MLTIIYISQVNDFVLKKYRIFTRDFFFSLQFQATRNNTLGTVPGKRGR